MTGSPNGVPGSNLKNTMQHIAAHRTQEVSTFLE